MMCVSMISFALWSSDISSYLRFGGVGGRIGNDVNCLKALSAYPSGLSAIGGPGAVSRGAWAVADGDAKNEEVCDDEVEETEEKL